MMICGRKLTTPPTPPMTPSHTRPITQSDAPASTSRLSTNGEKCPWIRLSSPSIRNEPTGPNVVRNMMHISTAKMGSASHLFITMRSMRSVVVSLGFIGR